MSRKNPIRSTPQALLESPAAGESRRIIDRLRAAGFVAYLAGGCVRDAWLGRPPKDYDVATDARPEAVRELFGRRRTLAYGAAFGVIGVLPPRPAGENPQPVEPTEVATFRSDGDYSDGRRPDSVHYGDARHDALRRDFTINGLFYDTHQHRVIDYVDGQQDLAARRLRTIGHPLDRFGEDKLRMLRAVRFATTLGFRIEPATLAAIRNHADDLTAVSGERVGAEMRRILVGSYAADGLQRLIDCRLDQAVLPEVENADLGRFQRLVAAAAPGSFVLALAALLVTTSDGEAALKRIGDRWRLSNEEIRQVTAALRHWPVVATADRRAWSEVQPVLMDRDAATIVALAAAIVTTGQQDPGGVARARQALDLPPLALNPPPLIDGHDLAGLGIPAGPRFRDILQSVRDAQLDGKITSKQEALRMATRIAHSNR